MFSIANATWIATSLVKLRPIQFCMFFKALVGTEEMTRMMVEAIKVAKRV
jgi:hypothetical protein